MLRVVMMQLGCASLIIETKRANEAWTTFKSASLHFYLLDFAALLFSSQSSFFYLDSEARCLRYKALRSQGKIQSVKVRICIGGHTSQEQSCHGRHSSYCVPRFLLANAPWKSCHWSYFWLARWLIKGHQQTPYTASGESTSSNSLPCTWKSLQCSANLQFSRTGFDVVLGRGSLGAPLHDGSL